MVNVMKGILVECDPAMKQFLLHLDEKEALGRKFVIQDLDETHIFISSDILPILRDRIDDLMDKLSFPLNENMKCDEMKNNIGKKVALAWSWKIVKRRLGPDAELFQEGDLYCKLAAKYIPLDTWKDLQSNRFEQFCCGLANCTQTFDSLSKYESHYNSCHRNVCQTCHRILPSAHLLDLHILETHDVMFTILAEKQDMYQCLLESCSQKFREMTARRDHMVKVHKYPSNYRYDRSEHKRAKKNSSKIDVPETMETESTACEKSEQNIPTSGRIFSYKVPKNISFGQGASRGFLGGHGRGRGKQSKKKHWHNMDTGDKNTIVDINNVDMSELSDALS